MEQTGQSWSSKVVYMTATMHLAGAFAIASRERFRDAGQGDAVRLIALSASL